MEDTLRLMVREHGFEAIFTSLKTIVGAEYERAKRDYEFLQTMMQKPEQKPEEEEQSEVKEEAPVDPDVKTVEIVGKGQQDAAPAKPRKFFKKAPKA